jgi:hypothetical protein
MLISFVIRGELHYSVWEEEADDMNMPDITDVPFIRSNSKEGSLRFFSSYSRRPREWKLLARTLHSTHSTVEGENSTLLHFIYNDFATFEFSFSSASLSVASYTHRHQTIIFLMDRGVLKRERRNIYKKII